jgi:hypothetical protein
MPPDMPPDMPRDLSLLLREAWGRPDAARDAARHDDPPSQPHRTWSMKSRSRQIPPTSTSALRPVRTLDITTLHLVTGGALPTCPAPRPAPSPIPLLIDGY